MLTSVVIRMTKYLGFILTSTLAGMILLCAVYMLPVDRMKSNIDYIKDLEWGQYEYLQPGIEGTYLNNYTDAFMLNTAICNSETGVLNKANAAYSYEYDDNGVNSLVSYLKGEEGYTLRPYARYWNGYLVVLKPLLLFLSYEGIRKLNLVLQTCLLIYLVVLMLKKDALRRNIVPFLIGILLLYPYAISKNMHFSVIYYILLVSLIVRVYLSDRIEGKTDFFFLLIGITVSFFELSTYPMVTLVFPLIFNELMTESKEYNTLPGLKNIILNSWAWVCGYIGMWGAKWILSSLVLKDNIIKDAVGQVLFRTSGSDLNGIRISKAGVLWQNIKDYFNIYIGILIVVFILLTVFYHIKFSERLLGNKNLNVAMFFLAAIPLFWIMAKTNHSYIHHWMTHREISASWFALFVIIWNFKKEKVDGNA